MTRLSKSGLFFLFLILVLILPAFASENRGAPPIFSRTEDPIVIAGEKLQPLLNQEISLLGLFADRAGKLSPVPFQIDKKDKDGQYTLEMTKSGDKWQRNPELPSSLKLEKNDEIVFRSRDLGEKASPDKWPSSQGLEIEVTDPVNQSKAYAYLLAFLEPAPRSPVDFIEFRPESSLFLSDELSSKIPVFLNFLVFGRDPKSPNLFDRFKLRIGTSFLFGKIKVEKTEEDFQARLLAYTDGPIRVITIQELRADLVAGVKSPWIKQVSISYPNRIDFPIEIHIPFRPGLIINEAHATNTFDFSENISGSILYYPSLPAPLVVDGVMSPAELNVPSDYPPWCALAGKFGGIVTTLKYDDNVAQADIKKTFFYRDDRNYRDQFDNKPGSFGEMGIKITGMENLKGGVYRFRMVFYGRKNFKPGDEKEFLQIESHPLEAEIHFPEKPLTIKKGQN